MRHPHFALAALAFALIAPPALAHAIGGTDAAFVAATRGPDPFPFLYLGAKHMVTGYDHLLFLVGVIFFLYRLREWCSTCPCSRWGIRRRCCSG
jgi:hypothetical protein